MKKREQLEQERTAVERLLCNALTAVSKAGRTGVTDFIAEKNVREFEKDLEFIDEQISKIDGSGPSAA